MLSILNNMYIIRSEIFAEKETLIATTEQSKAENNHTLGFICCS